MLFEKNPRLYKIFFGLCIFLYLLGGIRTASIWNEMHPFTENMMEDFGYYEGALIEAIQGRDPYALQIFGPAFLYPLPSLFVVEFFHYINPTFLRFIVFALINIAILLLMVTKVAEYYGYTPKQVWYWYVLCLFFAPFLELLHVGQINVITLLGIFMMFYWMEKSYITSGFGLSLAVLTKFTPVLFFGYLLANKRYKVIASALIWMLVLTALSAWRYSLEWVWEYPSILYLLSNQFPVYDNVHSLLTKIVVLSNYSIDPSAYKPIQQALTLYILLLISGSFLMVFFRNQPKEHLFIITGIGMTVMPNVMWYHHYVFILLPLIVWMGWKRLDVRVVIWCLFGLMIIQADRFYLTYGFLIHLFSHITILVLLSSQIKAFLSERALQSQPG